MAVSTTSVAEGDIMQEQTVRPPMPGESPPAEVERASLLAEVDFKWLMSGQGWWVDTNRFHKEPAYAAALLKLALASQSFALRECAALLGTLRFVPQTSSPSQ